MQKIDVAGYLTLEQAGKQAILIQPGSAANAADVRKQKVRNVSANGLRFFKNIRAIASKSQRFSMNRTHFIPPSDAFFWRPLSRYFLQQVQGKVPQGDKVCRFESFSYQALIFAKRDIDRPG